VSDLTVRLVLTADGRPLRTEIVGASRQVEQFTREMERNGVRVERASVQAEAAVRRIGAGAQAAAAQAAPPLDLVAARLRAVATAGTQVLTTVGGLPGSLGSVANAGGRMAAALTGGFAGLAVQLGVIAAQMLLFGGRTEGAAAANEQLAEALEYAERRMITAEAAARRAAEAKRQEAEETLRNARAIQEETLAALRQDLEFARIGRITAEDLASRPARRGTLRQSVARSAAEARAEDLRAIEGSIAEAEAALARIDRAIEAVLSPSADEVAQRGGAAAAARAERALDPFARLKEEARRLEAELRTPLERYLDTVRRLEELARGGFIGQETFARGIARAREELERAQAAADGTAQGLGGMEAAFDRLADSVQGFGRDAARAMAEALVGLRALDGGVVGLIQRLASGVIEKLIHEQITGPLTQAAAVLLRTGLASLFRPSLGPVTAIDAGIPVSAFPFHTGGIVGREGGAARAVPVALFADAPRLHRGGFVGAGEVPAILKAGEGVFTPEQMKAMGGTVVQIIDQRGAGAPPVETRETRGPDGRRLVQVLVRAEVAAMVADGSLDRLMGAGYGIQRVGVR
jgi:hypothetical protein